MKLVAETSARTSFILSLLSMSLIEPNPMKSSRGTGSGAEREDIISIPEFESPQSNAAQWMGVVTCVFVEK